jgi:hypothetical protein
MSDTSPRIVFLCALLLLISALPVQVGGATGDGGAFRADSGTAITPAFAQSLYDQVAPLRESDGCRLARFDTQRSFIAIGLQTGASVEHALQIAPASRNAGSGRRAGPWALAVPAALERDCGETLAAIERVLAATGTPQDAPWQADRWTAVHANYSILAMTFVVLVLWTVRALYREARAQEVSWQYVAALVFVWVVALALRLWLSPHTFLHEHYHIAETLPAYLRGETGPMYGDTGPALFQLAGMALGRPDDFRVIFLTNAFLASLAVPAVALLVLALVHNRERAFAAAVLLCVLPLHLRYSASEILFVQSVTFGLWALGLFALYVRTRRLDDALGCVLALSLAMQTRPEMLLFPAVLAALLLLTEPRAWRVLFDWRALLALSVLTVLLVPRFFELRQVLASASTPPPNFPDLQRYLNGLVVLQGQAMPPIYQPLLVVGTLCALWHKPGLVVWVALVFVGHTFLTLSLFDNGPYNLRSQLLPTSLLMLVAAGVAPVWMSVWRRHHRLAVGLGSGALAVLGTVIVVQSHGFVTELRDQQLEWEFLARTIPQLPEQGTLLSVIEVGGRNLDAFPTFLLHREGKSYRTVDLRSALEGKIELPTPGSDLLFYRGMFCYFAFTDEPPPAPMSELCRAVHERYVAEPLFIENLDVKGYSPMIYAPGPFRIGFYRLSGLR